ncbi:hypothetical protein H0H93_006149 [Arthromyces matolae]|nr:hypothetical protein H0H93_006149 [Arthromyces matolae]
MFPTIPIFSVVSQPFKRAQLGLFQGKTKQYGNNVPFSKHKTRRTWLPNVQRKRLSSDILGEDVRVKVTTRALRTIKKYGGLDNYVEKSPAKLLGQEGIRLRLQIRDAHAQKLENTSKTVRPPTLSDALHAREQAMEALGMDTLPNARRTIAFLRKQRKLDPLYKLHPIPDIQTLQ